MGAPTDYWIMVPFYSNLEYLRQTLESVVAQTDRAWRAVVVDDSPDDAGVGDVVRSLGDERIGWVRNPSTLGVAGNFNRCFDLARERSADLVMILHADDLLGPGYVAQMRHAHRERPGVGVIAPRAGVIDTSGQPTHTLADLVKSLLWPRHQESLAGEEGLRRLLRGQFFYCPSVSFRLGLVPERPWNPQWVQVMDLDLFARLILDGGTIGLVGDRLFQYRRHAATTTETNSLSLVRTDEELRLSRELAAAAASLGWNTAARTGRCCVMVRLQTASRLPVLLLHPPRRQTLMRALRMIASTHG